MNLRRRSLLTTALFVCLFFSFVVAARASTVRGRLDHIYPNGQRGPATGFAVTVYNPSRGRSNPSYTDQQGMYYLQNVPPGTYNLEIWVSTDPRVSPVVYVIEVVDPYTDVPPILV